MSDQNEVFTPLSPQEFRQALLQFHLDQERFHSQVASEHGKWLLASLLLVNGGGLLGLFSIAEKEALAPLNAAAAVLVAGLVLGLLTGFLTWLNWLLLASSYEQISNTRILVVEQEWFKDVRKSTRLGIKLALWSSMIAGFGSALCIPIAAYLVMIRPT